MTHSDNRSDCFERAQMHDRLAASTNDTAARQMHQAMAAEFRRRAAQPGSDDMPQPSARGPLLEMSAPG
ncbi:hypothetical protein [Novosphingobium rosa]|uniref:hypothetical protein n=1 Tax=Novosphingobium rosa TaxID=76978 RepID=UPI000829B71D|nr:hypothetical protein [Novosphingobium rosa]